MDTKEIETSQKTKAQNAWLSQMGGRGLMYTESGQFAKRQLKSSIRIDVASLESH